MWKHPVRSLSKKNDIEEYLYERIKNNQEIATISEAFSILDRNVSMRTAFLALL